MSNFIDNIKYNFRHGGILTKFIFVNVFVYLLLLILYLVGKLFVVNTDVSVYIALYSNINTALVHAWTLFTYMFVHYDFLHILFNMLVLYGFGRIFLTLFNEKQLGSLYILGGLAGGVLYLLIYNLIPYFVLKGNIPMVGASASVMAIIFAVAFYMPNMQVNMFLLGRIKLIYIAIALLVMDLLTVFWGGDNQGGHIAHIGGALLGYLFAKQYLKGKDITRPTSRLIDQVVNIFSKKPRKPAKMKVKYKRPETDYQYNRRRANETEEIDRILDKIKASGYSSLNKEEKKRLFDASNK
ncbi:membrane associated rhomboid family serine protease [Dysgonomonas sp. PH5-45]|uniref:rhomboid family protein n=1 Tax=unclassified Dysgonomonas TaxID=2630389 RepID=UPI00247487F2|nr:MULTISPECIES: rhomboid family intramembrane serine protease [unclassified Dysgonomonas]MDH6353790.1 membrane associated rhomboid family serine protease [Dysgonomonas sp. PH5-45]MDH6386692.1 membrane associated rhomboid family serine protease [Dysgonomonas sp. PH5-37]